MRRTGAAVLWLRYRVLVNELKGAGRSQAERTSRALAVVVVAISALGALAIAVALGFFAFAAGAGSGSLEMREPFVAATSRIFALAALAFLVIVPVGRATTFGRESPMRLHLLPIRASELAAIETVAVLADPWTVVFLPALVTFPLGLAVRGAVIEAIGAAAAGVALIALIASLGLLVGAVLQWALAERRRSEIASVLFVVVLSSFGIVPTLVDSVALSGGGRIVFAVTRSLPPWLFERAIGGALSTELTPIAVGIGGLLAWSAALLALAIRLRTRVVFASGGDSRRHTSRLGRRTIPLLPAPTAAVAAAMFSSWLRSVRGKLAVFVPAPMVALMLVAVWRIGSKELGVGPLIDGPLIGLGTAAFVTLSLFPITLNQLGADREGLVLELLLPLEPTALLAGKCIAAAALYAASCTLCAIVVAVLVPGDPVRWLTASIAMAAIGLGTAAGGAVLSVLLPRRSDLSSAGSAGNAHPLAAIVGIVALLATAAPSAVILVLSLLLDARWLGLTAEAVWLCLVAAIAAGSLSLAGRLLQKRAEQLATVAQGR